VKIYCSFGYGVGFSCWKNEFHVEQILAFFQGARVGWNDVEQQFTLRRVAYGTLARDVGVPLESVRCGCAVVFPRQDTDSAVDVDGVELAVLDDALVGFVRTGDERKRFVNHGIVLLFAVDGGVELFVPVALTLN